MGIVILILKIIGIILLILLGILLLAVISIVFYPISYTMAASYEDAVSAKAKVHWLFHLISVTLAYEKEDKKCVLRILGIPVMDFFHPRPKKEKTKRKKLKKEKTKKEKPPKEKPQKETSESKNNQQAVKEAVKEQKKTEQAAAVATKPAPDSGNEAEQDTKAETEAPKQKIFTKLQQFITNIKAVHQKGIDLKKKADKSLEILKREQTRNAIEKVKHHIIALLKHILPRKWNAYLNFGFEDPATTGQLLGYYWMLIGLWGEHFVCVPDFEHKVLRGNIRMKGHIQVIKFLYVAYRFMFDKDLVYLRKIYSEINA